MLRCTLPKGSRLSGRNRITELFAQGKKIEEGVITAIYLSTEEGESSVLVSVPKKLHKRAVVRNLLKRRIREAYRLNRVRYAQCRYRLALLYNSTREGSYTEIEASVTNILERLSKKH